MANKPTKSDLLAILRIGHQTSCRGTGISLREALTAARYLDLRPTFGSHHLLPFIQSNPNITQQWIAYSEDKRTSGGWYISSNGEIGQVGFPESRIGFESIEEAAAEYVVRELDYWVGVD